MFFWGERVSFVIAKNTKNRWCAKVPCNVSKSLGKTNVSELSVQWGSWRVIIENLEVVFIFAWAKPRIEHKYAINLCWKEPRIWWEL
jgi:hypothetical protein